jgi:arylsulfatase
MPLHGKSIASTFTDGRAPAPRSRQYFEQFGHRGLWDDGWKITTYHQPGQPFDDDEWGLFHVDEDFSECHDLAAQNPEKLREMIDAWWVEAGEYGVLPLDDRMIELFLLPTRPGTPHARDDYVYYPPISHIMMDAAPKLGMSSWTIIGDVTIPPGGAQGVLYAMGSHNIGLSFFLSDGQLQFDYNALAEHHRARAPLSLTPGRHTLTARLDAAGMSGTLTIGADGNDLGSVQVPKLMLILGPTGLDVGRDSLSPVVEDYPAPFPFTGDIHSLTVTLRPNSGDTDNMVAFAAAELAKE